MARRRVTHTGKNANGSLRGLCNPEADWYSTLIPQAIAEIGSGTHSYYTGSAGHPSEIRVVTLRSGGKYLRTTANAEHNHNLGDLPTCNPLSEVMSHDAPIRLLWNAKASTPELTTVETTLGRFADRLYDCTDGQWRIARFTIQDDRSTLSEKGEGVGHVHRGETHTPTGWADGRPHKPKRWEVNEGSSPGAYLMEFLHSWTGLKDEYETKRNGPRTNCPSTKAVRDSSNACVMDDTYETPTELCRPENHNPKTEQGDVRGMDCYSWVVKVMHDAGHKGFQMPSRIVPGPVSTKTWRFVYLTVKSVQQIDDPDPGFTQGSSDYYAKVKMDGATYAKSNHVDNSTRRLPNWLFGLAFASDEHRKIPIRLEIWDHDSTSSDDLCDLNPKKGKKRVDFAYDTATGQISGDITGTRDSSITLRGSGDSDRAEATIMLTSR